MQKNKRLLIVLFILVFWPLVYFLPLAAQAQPIQWLSNGHWYEIVDSTAINWFEANGFANAKRFNGLKGHLVTITSEAENQFLIDSFNANLQNRWIGGFQFEGAAEPNGGWTWVTGEVWQYTNWDTVEPNNAGGNENALIFAGGAFWNDKDASDNAPWIPGYVVEYEPSLAEAQNYAPVPKTGQTQSYATGDDGDFQMGVEWPNPRFTDNGDGTVTDNLTDLIWLKFANCFGEIVWYDALEACNNLEDGECGLSDNSSPGDWRLPNIRELNSLVDYNNIAPALPSGHPFSDVQSREYWSSTTYADHIDDARLVHMHLGDVVNYDKVISYHRVWPVRNDIIDGVFQQDSGSNGILCMEAENYHGNFIQNGHEWDNDFTSGYSGAGAMKAVPDSGVIRTLDYEVLSPQLDYRVNIVKTGYHYVWIRGYGKDTSSDSIHAGLDGKVVYTSANIKNFQPKQAWAWAGSSMIKILIQNPGKHTINLWMREDGFIVDKIVLTINTGYIPSGFGPPESPTK